MDQQGIELGLLAGLSDSRLAKAINAMHADPGRVFRLPYPGRPVLGAQFGRNPV
jgi:hypothetical protein